MLTISCHSNAKFEGYTKINFNKIKKKKVKKKNEDGNTLRE
jgi:hypothetical protein